MLQTMREKLWWSSRMCAKCGNGGCRRCVGTQTVAFELPRECGRMFSCEAHVLALISSSFVFESIIYKNIESPHLS